MLHRLTPSLKISETCVCVCVCGWEMWEMAFMALRVASGCSCNLSPPRGRRLHDAGGPRDAVPY